jgi:hypothetical protein
MAFVLKQSDTYTWPVSFEIPVDGGRFVRQTFDAEFKRPTQTRIVEIQELVMARLRAIQNDEETAGMITDLEIAGEILVGWSGIEDGKDGKSAEVPYSEKAKAQVLDMPAVSASIVEAFFDSLKGAKRKN